VCSALSRLIDNDGRIAARLCTTIICGAGELSSISALHRALSIRAPHSPTHPSRDLDHSPPLTDVDPVPATQDPRCAGSGCPPSSRRTRHPDRVRHQLLTSTTRRVAAAVAAAALPTIRLNVLHKSRPISGLPNCLLQRAFEQAALHLSQRVGYEGAARIRFSRMA
jgi:hypothetical protein